MISNGFRQLEANQGTPLRLRVEIVGQAVPEVLPASDIVLSSQRIPGPRQHRLATEI
jgi:hypothetical protein